MTDPILLSVLITSYNRQEYISHAIESVLESSFKEFELVIVDDFSTDNTVNIIQSYAEKDKRIRLHVNEKNLGQFANRNKAASIAKGRYLKFVDSDDMIYPYSLQIMVDAMLKYPEAGLGFCIKYNETKKPYPFLLQPSEAFFLHYFQNGLLAIGPSGLIISKECFDLVGGFDEYGMPSDNHLSLKIAGKFPVVALQPDLFWWRQHENQVFNLNKMNYHNILNNYLFNIDIINNSSPLNNEQNSKIILNQKKIFYRNIIRLTFRRRKPLAALSLIRKYFKIK